MDLDPTDPFVYGKKSITQVWPAKSGYAQIGGAQAAHALYKAEQIGTTNVYPQYPEVVERLQALLESYRQKIGPQPNLGWIDNRRQ